MEERRTCLALLKMLLSPKYKAVSAVCACVSPGGRGPHDGVMLYREKKERLLPMGVYMGARNMGGWVVVSTGGRWSNSPATAVGASPSRSRLTTFGKVVVKKRERGGLLLNGLEPKRFRLFGSELKRARACVRKGGEAPPGHTTPRARNSRGYGYQRKDRDDSREPKSGARK